MVNRQKAGVTLLEWLTVYLSCAGCRERNGGIEYIGIGYFDRQTGLWRVVRWSSSPDRVCIALVIFVVFAACSLLRSPFRRSTFTTLVLVRRDWLIAELIASHGLSAWRNYRVCRKVACDVVVRLLLVMHGMCLLSGIFHMLCRCCECELDKLCWLGLIWVTAKCE